MIFGLGKLGCCSFVVYEVSAHGLTMPTCSKMANALPIDLLM